MNIKTEFTKSECDRFREECNFTPDELAVFDLRVQGKSIVAIQSILSEKQYVSEATVNRRLKNIKNKIRKVLSM